MMKKRILKRINAVLGAAIVGLAGTTMTGCGYWFAADYGVEPVVVEDPHVIALYGVPSPNLSEETVSEADTVNND